MKTDWKSLKGKNILIRWVHYRWLFLTFYRDSIQEQKVKEVSPSGKLVHIVHPMSDEVGGWQELNDFKLLDVLTD